MLGSDSTRAGFVQAVRLARMPALVMVADHWCVPLLTQVACSWLGWSAGEWAAARLECLESTPTLPPTLIGSGRQSTYFDYSESSFFLSSFISSKPQLLILIGYQ